MNKLYFKVKTGFAKEDYVSIESEEIHKAFYLFLNPEQRSIFSNGVALIGKSILGIEPDYNKTMGWNTTYKLGDEDWVELRQKGLPEKMQSVMSKAKQISFIANTDKNILGLPLSKIESPFEKTSELTSGLAEKMRLK